MKNLKELPDSTCVIMSIVTMIVSVGFLSIASRVWGELSLVITLFTLLYCVGFVYVIYKLAEAYHVRRFWMIQEAWIRLFIILFLGCALLWCKSIGML